MREIRIFELEHGEPTHAWRLAQPLQLQVSEGEVWLTIGGDAGDYWLRAGEAMTLARGALVRISAGRAGARFALASGGASAPDTQPAVVRGLARSLVMALRGLVLRAGSRSHAAG